MKNYQAPLLRNQLLAAVLLFLTLVGEGPAMPREWSDAVARMKAKTDGEDRRPWHNFDEDVDGAMRGVAERVIGDVLRPDGGRWVNPPPKGFRFKMRNGYEAEVVGTDFRHKVGTVLVVKILENGKETHPLYLSSDVRLGLN